MPPEFYVEIDYPAKEQQPPSTDKRRRTKPLAAQPGALILNQGDVVNGKFLPDQNTNIMLFITVGLPYLSLASSDDVIFNSGNNNFTGLLDLSEENQVKIIQRDTRTEPPVERVGVIDLTDFSDIHPDGVPVSLDTRGTLQAIFPFTNRLRKGKQSATLRAVRKASTAQNP